jgi:hypothetical protein
MIPPDYARKYGLQPTFHNQWKDYFTHRDYTNESFSIHLKPSNKNEDYSGGELSGARMIELAVL